LQENKCACLFLNTVYKLFVGLLPARSAAMPELC